jgi:iron complex outermembrane receptor protein
LTARYASATFETDQNIDKIRGVPGAYDPFFLMNINVNYRVTKHVELSSTSDNLLDRQYFQFYRTPGRSTYAGVRLHF